MKKDIRHVGFDVDSAKIEVAVAEPEGEVRSLGAKFVELPYVLASMQKLSVLGDVDPEEWKRRPAEIMTASILRQVRPGSIIGLHDTMGPETIRTLEQTLASLTADGYRFETVSQFVRRRQ